MNNLIILSSQLIFAINFKNSEMQAEGELRSNLDESDRVRELQDKVADLKAEVRILESFLFSRHNHLSFTSKINCTLIN